SELKIYGLSLCFILFKARSSASLEETFGILLLYLKVASLALLYQSTSSILYPALYSLSCLVLFAVLPQPPYYGPGEIIPLNKEALDVFIGSSTTKASSKPEVRVLLLDVLWSSRCLNFQAVVASLSLKYTTPQIKFGKISESLPMFAFQAVWLVLEYKLVLTAFRFLCYFSNLYKLGRIDLDEDPSYESRFKVDASPTSLQLPTLILFVDGVEKARLPNARSDSNENALSMWNRSEESVVCAFDLKKYYSDSASALD
ncbi:hypothetical protein DSO57_1038683, partial [Entomophthora muscae]